MSNSVNKFCKYTLSIVHGASYQQKMVFFLYGSDSMLKYKLDYILQTWLYDIFDYGRVTWIRELYTSRYKRWFYG